MSRCRRFALAVAASSAVTQAGTDALSQPLREPVARSSQPGGLLWGTGFEGGHAAAYKAVRRDGSGHAGSHVVTTKRARTGARSLKITVPASTSRAGDSRYQLSAGMPNGVAGDDRWYGFSILLGEGWNLRQIRDSGKYFLGGFGFRYSGPSTNGPGGNLDADVIGGSPEFLMGTNLSGKAADDHMGEHRLGQVVKGQWIDFVVHIKWSRVGDGLREEWRNGSKMGRYDGPTLGIKAPFDHRIGLYQGSGVDHTRTLYIDNHRVGTTYAAVDPAQAARRSPRR